DVIASATQSTANRFRSGVIAPSSDSYVYHVWETLGRTVSTVERDRFRTPTSAKSARHERRVVELARPDEGLHADNAEAEQARQDEVNRHQVIEEARHDQDQDSEQNRE